MVDIETTGTDPAHAAIIQIAAVRFNYENCSIGEMFCVPIEMLENRFWDEDTRAWWMKQGATYEDICYGALPARIAFQEFQTWCRETSPALSGVEQRLWAKPISFEWPFLQSYSRALGLELPFHYRNCIDLNSFTRGMQGQPGALPLDRQFDIPFDGVVHNALDDVLHQIKQAFMAKVLLK